MFEISQLENSGFIAFWITHHNPRDELRQLDRRNDADPYSGGGSPGDLPDQSFIPVETEATEDRILVDFVKRFI